MATLTTTRDDVHGDLVDFWPSSITADGLSTASFALPIGQHDMWVTDASFHSPLRYQLNTKVDQVNSVTFRMKVLSDPETVGQYLMCAIAFVYLANTPGIVEDTSLTGNPDSMDVIGIYDGYYYLGASSPTEITGVTVADGEFDLTFSFGSWSTYARPDRVPYLQVNPVVVDDEFNEDPTGDGASVEIISVSWDYEPTNVRIHKVTPAANLDTDYSLDTNSVLFSDLRNTFGWEESVSQIDAIEIDYQYEYVAHLTTPEDRYEWFISIVGELFGGGSYWSDVDWTFYPSDSTVDRYQETTDPYNLYVVGATDVLPSSGTVTGIYQEDPLLYRSTLRIEFSSPRNTDLLDDDIIPTMSTIFYCSDDEADVYYNDTDSVLRIIGMRSESPVAEDLGDYIEYCPMYEFDNTLAPSQSTPYGVSVTAFPDYDTLEELTAVEWDLEVTSDPTTPNRYVFGALAIGAIEEDGPLDVGDENWSIYTTGTSVDLTPITVSYEGAAYVGLTFAESSTVATGIVEASGVVTVRLLIDPSLEEEIRTDITNLFSSSMSVADVDGDMQVDGDAGMRLRCMRLYGVFGEAPPPELPTPVAGTIDFPRLTSWDFYLDDRALIGGSAPAPGRDYLLTRAENRTVTFNLEEPHRASFTIDGNHPESELVEELVQDLVAVRNGQTLFRGRIGSSDDELDPSGHKVTFAANSYRAMLDHRIIRSEIDTVSSAVEQEEIGWDAIDASQGFDAGDLGITRGSGQTTGVLRGDVWPIGTFIGDLITDMSEREYGFDWDIDVDLVYRVYSPNRGGVKGFPLEYGGTAIKVRRAFDGADFANYMWTEGTVSSSSTWRGQYLSGLASRPEGLWEDTWGAGEASTTAELDAIAAGQLSRASAAIPAYTFTLRQGDWTGPDDFWIGDTVPVIIRTGRLNIVENYRVYRMTFTIDPNGLESLVVTAGAPEMSFVRRLWRYGRRITNLENR